MAGSSFSTWGRVESTWGRDESTWGRYDSTSGRDEGGGFSTVPQTASPLETVVGGVEDSIVSVAASTLPIWFLTISDEDAGMDARYRDGGVEVSLQVAIF